MESIWDASEKINEAEKIEGNIQTDVLIIGGGMCGIMCAYMLREAGVDCIVAESDKICRATTAGTTAKVTVQHGLIYDKIISKYGQENARLYYESQKKALEKIREIAEKTNCDFEECAACVYSLEDTKKIEKEARALEKIGCKAHFCTETELPFEVSGAVKIEKQGKFHPLEFAEGICQGLKIYENARVFRLKEHEAVFEKGSIFAKKIIVATHFPFINKHGAYFMKMYQHRSYVIALKNAHNIKDMYVDESKKGLSFRSYKDILLLGGGSHRTGNDGGGWAELERVKEKYYPHSQVVGRWAAQDCMTLDSIPYIGQYSKSTPNLYVATGFNKWGMTSSMVSAMLLRDIVCQKENEYAPVYSPSRNIFHGQLAINMFESAKGLITPTAPRCPHMGCALKYNKAEHSWDCSCHGSRFDENGKVLNNPATENKD